ncbi:MAG: GTP 3',8-cyclase MoaA [Bacteroidetes bacterium]|nr:GTP 3',8-cyclase MoaA [Bacteroidota bacterium]
MSTLLTDQFGRFHSYLRISLTPACNFRCTYCMPEEGHPALPSSHLLSAREIIKLVSWLADEGVTKVRLTGGEPTLRKDLVEIVEGIGRIPQIRQIGMTTNGFLLGEQLPRLIEAGLTSVNISLDSLSEQTFQKIARTNGLSRVLDSIHLALQTPEIEVKINSVLMRGINETEAPDLVRYFSNQETELRFIEFMPFGGNHWELSKFVPSAETRLLISNQFELEKINETHDSVSEPFRIKNHPLKVGFISSITDQFCTSCSRIRLTADGKFRSCLFDDGEVDLLTPLRKGADKNEILSLLTSHLKVKPAKHGGHDFSVQTTQRSMTSIGG